MVKMVKERVVDLIIEENQIILQASEIYQVDDVILATGHSQNELNQSEEENQNHANKHGLFYQSPGNPSDTQLGYLIEGEPVILRGLGLSFFDYIALFVDRWGGKFFEGEDGCLGYRPSGKEQLLIAGSGRVLTYHARPNNQKKLGEDAQPQILT